MGEDWSRWLDTAPDSAADETGGDRKARVVRLPGGARTRVAGEPRPILVVGGCGGAGTTTTTLGLAGELGLGGAATIAVDATPAGVISRCAAPTSICIRSACSSGCTAGVTTNRLR